MAAATTIKEIKTKDGKTKYQAQVWHKGVFYCSKTFDIEKLARDFKEKALEQVVRGKLEPASVRAADRRVNAALDQPMTHWAALYVREMEHGDARLAEYRLVGQLLADKKLRDFSGKAGAQLIERLARDWRFDRRPRSKKPRPADAPPPKPLGDQTVRLRLTALLRLIPFAKSKLPPNACFEMPTLKEDLFKFKLPPPHSNPRRREPSDCETARLLRQVGTESEFGQFLRVIDETGCRLSEVRMAKGSDVHFFTVAGQVIGGCLVLAKHKTSKKVGPREVPLSLFAAQILHGRKLQYGDGPLFASLGSADAVCKEFDEKCCELEIIDLLIKDYRRGFINRNKYCVAHVDIVKVVGQSSLLDGKNLSPSEQRVLEAVGHTAIGTTVGYSNPRLAELANTFTATSRWPRVAALLQPKAAATGASPEEGQDVEGLQRELQDMLSRLARAGLTAQAV